MTGSRVLQGRIKQSLDITAAVALPPDQLQKIKRGDTSEAVVVDDARVMTYNSHARIAKHADAMDLASPERVAAFDVLKNILRRTADKSRRQQIRFGVLPIPSKERALYRFLKSSGKALPEDYERLVQNEDRL